jgi:hypothetical protein
MMNFKLSVDKWNLVSEQGLPEDGTACFLVWRSGDGGYHWSAGGYDAGAKEFFIDFGYGGLVLKAEDVVAWAVLFGDETFTAQ